MKSLVHQSVHITIVSFAVVVLTATTGIVLSAREQSGFVFFVFMAGTLGGIANNLRRLDRVPATDGPEPPPAVRRLVTLQIYLSPLIGGVFGTVLYVAFMAGVMQGKLFPAFAAVEDPFESTRRFSDAIVPATNGDAARALLWAFVAGFAERFVPNVIDRISRQAEAEAEARAAAGHGVAHRTDGDHPGAALAPAADDVDPRTNAAGPVKVKKGKKKHAAAAADAGGPGADGRS